MLTRYGLAHAPGARAPLRVRAGDGHGVVRLLAGCGGHMGGAALGEGRLWRRRRREEAVLGESGSRLGLDRGRLQGERLGVEDGVGLGLDELDALEGLFLVHPGVCGGREAWGLHVHGVRWGHGPEAWSVRGGLSAQLGEVQVGAGLVSHVHGLPEALLGVVPVEDDAVEDDCDGFKNDLDQAAN